MGECKIIAVTNNKGGVGKTTTTLNIGAALAKLGAKVLLIDLDPQANLSSILHEDSDVENYIGLALKKERKLTDLILTSRDFDIVPSAKKLLDTEVELLTSINRELLLSKLIDKEKIRDNYHYIIIDCPPSLGLLTVNALCAADEFLVPLASHFFSFNGLQSMLNFANRYKAEVNENLELLGIVLSAYNDNQRSIGKKSKQIANEIRTSPVGSQVFKTTIRKCDQLMESPMDGLSIFDYAPKSNGAEDYMNLTNEILQKHEKAGR